MDDACADLLRGQKRYGLSRRKDPARGMLSRFGSERTEAYIHDVLFDL